MAKEGTWEGTFEWNDEEVQGLNTISFQSTRDVIDITCMGSAVTARDRMSGLKDGTLTVSGPFDVDGAGQDSLRYYMMNRSGPVTANIGIGGTTTGWGMTASMASLSIVGEVGEAIKFTATMKCDGVGPAAASF